MQEKKSTKSSLNDTRELGHNVKCECGSRNNCIYYCIDQSCEHHAQIMYCDVCFESRKHEHTAVEINEELQNRIEQVKQLDQDYGTLKKAIDDNFYKYEALIKYLDQEQLQNYVFTQSNEGNLLVHIQNLQTKIYEFNQLKSKIESLYANGDLKKIFQKTSALQKFKDFYENVKYLRILNDQEDKFYDFIYELYKNSIKFAATSKFQNKLKLTIENRDSFNRLMFKDLYSRIQFLEDRQYNELKVQNSQGGFENIEAQISSLKNESKSDAALLLEGLIVWKENFDKILKIQEEKIRNLDLHFQVSSSADKKFHDLDLLQKQLLNNIDLNQSELKFDEALNQRIKKRFEELQQNQTQISQSQTLKQGIQAEDDSVNNEGILKISLKKKNQDKDDNKNRNSVEEQKQQFKKKIQDYLLQSLFNL